AERRYNGWTVILRWLFMDFRSSLALDARLDHPPFTEPTAHADRRPPDSRVHRWNTADPVLRTSTTGGGIRAGCAPLRDRYRFRPIVGECADLPAEQRHHP